MSRRNHAKIPRNTTHLAKRLAQRFSKRNLFHAARVMGPTLIALSFAGVAHAQGTMDFSGAQTLMGTFKWLAIFSFPALLLGAWLVVRKHPKMFQLWSLSLKQRSYYDPRK